MGSPRGSVVLFIAGLAFCLSPWGDPPLALLVGVLLSQSAGHPFAQHNARATKILLQASVVGLGFGMNLGEAARAGRDGFLFTVASIGVTFAVGLFLGRVLGIEKKVRYLITIGTAICGGSAIAAVSPIIEAEPPQMSVALGTVFILNAIALLLFPPIGRFLGLTQQQFGLWSAIAIHDTSSVVGAAHNFGEEALRIATTVKLERALWIIPVSLVTALFFRHSGGKIAVPWFIFLFIAAMALTTYLPALAPAAPWIVLGARKGLVITLFLIGAGLSRSVLKSVGLHPMLLGVLLWACVSVFSLLVILRVTS
jgi:uncharacterized integral membrane protein (TIGR00698 family)